MTALLLGFALTFLTSEPTSEPKPSQRWSSFRNGGSSTVPDGKLPTKWSPRKGIRWQTELRGYGQSSPVIWGGTVYVLSVEGLMKEKCAITAIDLKSGKVRWSHSCKSSTQAPSNYHVSRAAPTPVVDQQGVYAFFETGDLLALSHEGKVRWQRSLTKDYGAFQNHHGLGSSLVQDQTQLFLNVEHRGPSYLLAVNKADGKTNWKVKRKSGMSWSSPVLMKSQGEQQIIVSSNGTVKGYSTKSGEERWTLGDLGGNSKVSPTPSGSRLFIAAEVSEFGTEAAAARSNLCVQIGENEKESYKVLWRAKRAVCYYSSPVLCGNCAYYINERGIVRCLDQKTGKQHYVKRLSFSCWATPIVVGEHLYFFGTDGTTTILKAGPEGEVIAKNQLWDPENPPKPEKYKEAVHVRRSSTGGGGGPFLRLMAGDKNGDKKLTRDELPESLQRDLPNVDLNKDGALDVTELKKMGERFRQKRAGSKEASRDPLVCAAAAVDGALVIRTGTRLYCIGASQRDN